jgi:hypothetical protein
MEMRHITRKTKSLVGLALSAGLFGSAQAGSMLLDLDGNTSFNPFITNNATLVDELDWSAGSALAVDGNQAIVNWLNNEKNGVAHGGADEQFTLYAHMTLSSALNDGASVDPTGLGFSGPFGMGTLFELTAIIGFTEQVSSVTINSNDELNTAAFDFVDTNDDFFAIYFDDLTDGNGVQSDRLSGVGYGDGQLILQSGIQMTNGGAFNVKTDIPVSNIDQVGGDDWDGVQTVNGTGAIDTIRFDVGAADAVWDTAFFQNGISDAILTDINLTTPFGATGTGSNNPSQHFTTASLGTVGGVLVSSDGDYEVIDTAAANPISTSTIGALNGGITVTNPVFNANGEMTGFDEYAILPGSADFLFSQDTNSSWDSLSVPEPHPLVLIGLGLTMIGFVSKKRQAAS